MGIKVVMKYVYVKMGTTLNFVMAMRCVYVKVGIKF
jgi:hypothetical protein